MSEDVPQTLYRFFDAVGDLLYIGITADAVNRWAQHGALKDWWTEVVSITVEHYPNRASVLVAEANAIRTEHPRENYMHNRGCAPARPKTAGARMGPRRRAALAERERKAAGVTDLRHLGPMLEAIFSDARDISV